MSAGNGAWCRVVRIGSTLVTECEAPMHRVEGEAR